jgi:hypothetical protein
MTGDIRVEIGVQLQKGSKGSHNIADVEHISKICDVSL